MSQIGRYRLLFGAAALTYLITLFSVQYTGEEAVYTLGAYEMWALGNPLTAYTYGIPYWRPPLFNWLIAAVSLTLGWEHVLAAARLVSAVATIGSGLLLAFVAGRIWRSPERGALTALVFISFWEVLFYYGWLAYSDALFSFFALAAMLFAWLYAKEGMRRWLILAVVATFSGFMTKALTAFVFYGVALLGALWRERAWRRLRTPTFWIIHLISLAFILAWNSIARPGSGVLDSMGSDILGKLHGFGAMPYVVQLGAFPTHMLMNLLPLGGLFLWFLWRDRKKQNGWLDRDVQLAAGIALINFLPYWLAPQSSHRYVLPIYGLVAMVIAARLDQDALSRRRAVTWVVAAIGLKIVAAAWLFPAYTDKFRPDVNAIALDVERRSQGYPLYVSDEAWLGLSVAATIDIHRHPNAPLVFPPEGLQDGFILAEKEDPTRGGLVHDYQGRTALLCRGRACDNSR